MARLTERLLTHNINLKDCIPVAKAISLQMIKKDEPDLTHMKNRPPGTTYRLFFLTITLLVTQDLVNKRYLTLRKPTLNRFLEKGMNDPLYQETQSAEEVALTEELLAHIGRHLPILPKENSPKRKEEVDKWIDTWNTAPHAEKYKAYYRSLTNTEFQYHASKEALETLRDHRLHPGTKRVYFELLAFHEKWEQGLRDLLADEKDPLVSTPEQRSFIKGSLRHPVSFSFLHQWIERLIEKRTRPHYQEAIHFLLVLKDAYNEQGNEDRFKIWLNVLRKKYTSYHAFRKELDRFEEEM
ncbi:hypothetical protein [Alteribacter aurantiacus]|uniref:hypothetical protein n=1 Tax=Alteribacter aurantiacus TaxID=254410 RepID=UPI00040EDCEC|nr:hypothetical protein [Alteribacter aurantiacus]